MQKYTFFAYLRSIIGIKKISWGLLFTGFGFFSDLVNLGTFLPFIPASLHPFIYALIILIGITLILTGLYQYSNFLFRQFEDYKQNIPLALEFSEQAESFFRDYRILLKKAISTKKLEEKAPGIKFLKFVKGDGENALMVLHIDNIEEEYVGAQIACKVQSKVTYSGSSIPIEDYLGFLEITKVDQQNSIAYCLMKLGNNSTWQDIIEGVKNALARKLPDKTVFKLSVPESLAPFKKQEMDKFFDLIGKFNQY